MTSSLLGLFVEVSWHMHRLAGTGVLSKLQVRDAAFDILTDLAREVTE